MILQKKLFFLNAVSHASISMVNSMKTNCSDLSRGPQSIAPKHLNCQKEMEARTVFFENAVMTIVNARTNGGWKYRQSCNLANIDSYLLYHTHGFLL